MASDDVDIQLNRLVQQSPQVGQRVIGLVRSTCAGALSLPALPAEVVVEQPGSDAETVVADFAEQFSIDVSAVTDAQRAALTGALGRDVFGAVVQMYVADFLPRVAAGLTALEQPVDWLPNSRGGMPASTLRTSSSIIYCPESRACAHWTRLPLK